MSPRENVAGLLLANISVTLGLLAYPLGTPLIFGDRRISLAVGAAAIGAAVLARLSGPPPGEWRTLWRSWSSRAALGCVALGVVLASAGRPAAIALCGGAGLAGSILIALVSGERFVPGQFVRLFTLIGVITGLQPIATFGVERWDHYREIAERRRTEQEAAERIAAGETLSPSFQGRTLDLKPGINVRLNDSFFGNRYYDDSYARLGTGRRVLGGVPFQLDGIAMLYGKIAAKYGSTFPRRFELPAIGKCQRVHLLGGISMENMDFDGAKIARVTLRYADGKEWSADLVLGRNMASRLGLASERLPEAGCDLVWLGSNGLTEALARQYPGLTLRLSKTTLVNPRPDTEIVGLICESLALDPVPFVAAVTVD